MTAPLAASGSTPARGPYIAELDAFRAIAVLWVLVHHAIYGWSSEAQTALLNSLPNALTFVLSRGWLGVDLFFVLSGFLITGILLDTQRAAHYWKNFYGRRALRILPIYLLVVVVCAFAYTNHTAYFALSAAMLANLAGLFGVGIPHGPGVFWSLAVEEHFYLLWPLMVRLLSRTALTALGIALVTCIPVARAIAAARGMDIENEIYVLSWFRFDGLALGALLAIWVRSAACTRKTSLWLVAGLIGLAALVTVIGWPYGLMGTKTVAAAGFRYTQVQLLFGAAILAAVALRDTPWTALLKLWPIRVTSEYSYCIYLIHLSLGDAYMHFFGPRSAYAIADGTLTALGLRLAAILIASYVLAAISYRWIEKPCLALKRYF